MQDKQSKFWRDSHGIVHAVRADIHNVCPKGHTLITRVPNVTEVPPFCNLCFKQVVQSSWAGKSNFALLIRAVSQFALLAWNIYAKSQQKVKAKFILSHSMMLCLR